MVATSDRSLARRECWAEACAEACAEGAPLGRVGSAGGAHLPDGVGAIETAVTVADDIFDVWRRLLVFYCHRELRPTRDARVLIWGEASQLGKERHARDRPLLMRVRVTMSKNSREAGGAK